jgi:hypothetical protein
MICDLYYAYNDSTCVTNSAKPLNINLKDYLIVSGYILLGEIITLIYLCWTTIYNDVERSNCTTIIAIILIYFCAVFSLVWNIIGGVIFWSYMDNTTCSSNVFNYVFTSLIIKYVCHFMASTQS